MTTSATADISDGPRIVSVDSTTNSGNADGTDEYTVEYLGDGVVEINGYTVAPTPCHEVAVDGIHRSKYGDVVDLSLESGSGFCMTVLAGLTYTVRLEYATEPRDVLVSVPDTA
ncbi:hypothetical protein [Natrinema sp. 1APR25-10V2]|uniref:hypothetical protein n=1 Tax=Natrinema sp. 1APR25-10V2 TaxID=2951081 RepID=UPI0028772044|nr:hypothetical protein [Natrinema sp. 1APR25-10V2]MDS0474227.1 hypothetical protein [Natrinema sp. 1APR25-10V2]